MPNSIPDWLIPFALMGVFLAVMVGTSLANDYRVEKARQRGIELDPVELHDEITAIRLIWMGFMMLVGLIFLVLTQ